MTPRVESGRAWHEEISEKFLRRSGPIEKRRNSCFGGRIPVELAPKGGVNGMAREYDESANRSRGREPSVQRDWGGVSLVGGKTLSAPVVRMYLIHVSGEDSVGDWIPNAAKRSFSFCTSIMFAATNACGTFRTDIRGLKCYSNLIKIIPRQNTRPLKGE